MSELNVKKKQPIFYIHREQLLNILTLVSSMGYSPLAFGKTSFTELREIFSAVQYDDLNHVKVSKIAGILYDLRTDKLSADANRALDAIKRLLQEKRCTKD